MKNLFLALAFVLLGSLGFANDHDPRHDCDMVYLDTVNKAIVGGIGPEMAHKAGMIKKELCETNKEWDQQQEEHLSQF